MLLIHINNNMNQYTYTYKYTSTSITYCMEYNKNILYLNFA